LVKDKERKKRFSTKEHEGKTEGKKQKAEGGKQRARDRRREAAPPPGVGVVSRNNRGTTILSLKATGTFCRKNTRR